MYIEEIKSPSDLKKLSTEQKVELCGEIRAALIEKMSKHGGHIGPNLGAVELTVALHTVFDSPKDKIVFDVSHQSYTHKILTGRASAFLDSAHYDDVTGFTNCNESEHDFFTVGHTSTSVSLACGLAKARDVNGEKFNVIAVIGDGSLSGGEALEGLNNAAVIGGNLIIVVNDNEMSIAENQGGLYGNLKQLRDTRGKSECNLFRAMGFSYTYVEDGNDLNAVTAAFERVRDLTSPTVVHVRTTKGKGFIPAETDKETWHSGGPFDVKSGKYIYSLTGEDYSEITYNYLDEKFARNEKIVAITAATPTVMGFTKERRDKAGEHFVDVGIAEEHAVAFASGIAKGGATSVFGVYSAFFPRACDQLFQDLCLNSNPAVILVFLASVYGMNDATHLGFFDIPLMKSVPNLVYLAPAYKEEYIAMLNYATTQKERPVAIRVPSLGVEYCGKADETDYSILNKFEVCAKGKEVAIIGLGDFFTLAKQVKERLEKSGFTPTLINPKFITGLDCELLNSLKSSHSLVITIEDGVLEGGFGESVAAFYGDSEMKVKNYGITKGFPDGYDAKKLLEENGITVDNIVNYTKENVKVVK